MTAEQITRDAILLIADNPSEFAWNGATYDCTVGALTELDEMREGGLYDDNKLTVSTTVKKLDQNDRLVSRFPTSAQPTAGQKVTIDGEIYRITRRIYDWTKSIIVLELEES